MVLARLQRARFYRLFDPLLEYANGRLHVIEDGELAVANGVLSALARARIAYELWYEPELIEDYIEDNPNGLVPGELDEISLWLKGLTGDFFAARFPDGVTRLLNENRIFEVCGIDRELGSLVDAPRATVYTTLLPFDGAIVPAGYLLSNDLPIGPDLLALLDDIVESAMELDAFTRTANGLMIASNERRIKETEREIARLERQIARLEGRPSEPEVPTRRKRPRSDRIGRNDPCPCGSGKKYKRCCGHK